MKKKANNILWYSLILFAFVLPNSAYISTRILFVLFLIAIFLSASKFSPRLFIKSAWDILIYLMVIMVGLIYSSDVKLGVRLLETSFALLALPVIFHHLTDLDRKKVNTIFLSFALGVSTAGMISLVVAFVRYFTIGQNAEVFFFYEFTNAIMSHPTYLAYYLISAITYFLYAVNYEELSLPKWIFVVGSLFCYAILLLTGGQTAFVGLLFVFSFFLLKALLSKNNTSIQKLTFVIVIVMLVGMITVSGFSSIQREQSLNDSWNRFELWHSAIKANSNFVLGVGTGDYKQVLNEYFNKTDQTAYAIASLNSHNQFIQIFFSNGILGLIAIVAIILWPLYLAFKRNDQLGILLLFPFLIYGMTEVFLGRYQGVAFFALLHQVLITYYQYLKQPGGVKLI